MILDHIDNLELADAAVKRHGNELNSLRRLAEGLIALYHMVVKWEAQLTQPGNGDIRFMCFGNDPVLKQLPMGLVECVFHWYSVSAVNYVRLVARLLAEYNRTRPSPNDYVRRVLPEVLTYRNKVGAHFARASVDSRDSHADRQISVFPSIGWMDGRLRAGGLQLAMRKKGETSRSSAMNWSLTETHLQLARRFWPTLLKGLGKPSM